MKQNGTERWRSVPRLRDKSNENPINLQPLFVFRQARAELVGIRILTNSTTKPPLKFIFITL